MSSYHFRYQDYLDEDEPGDIDVRTAIRKSKRVWPRGEIDWFNPPVQVIEAKGTYFVIKPGYGDGRDALVDSSYPTLRGAVRKAKSLQRRRQRFGHDPGYKKGKIRPLTPVAQRKAAVTAFKRKFPGASIEGVRKTSAGWRVRGHKGYRAVKAIFTYRQLMQDIKGRRAEKGYPKRARKGTGGRVKTPMLNALAGKPSRTKPTPTQAKAMVMHHVSRWGDAPKSYKLTGPKSGRGGAMIFSVIIPGRRYPQRVAVVKSTRARDKGMWLTDDIYDDHDPDGTPRTAGDHGRGYYVTVQGKKKWFATKSAANRYKWKHGGRLKADRAKGRRRS